MKQRRRFIKKLGGLAAFLAVGGPGKATAAGKHKLPEPGNTEILQGDFVHMVFFWLKDNSGATKKKFYAELRKFIDHVDVIKRKHIGTPADTDREVIDSSYSYSLVVSFDSKKDHDLYQEHKLHKQFIENASTLWDRVLVYDSVNSY